MADFYYIDQETRARYDITPTEEQAFLECQSLVPRWFLSEETEFTRLGNILYVHWEKKEWMLSIRLLRNGIIQFHYLKYPSGSDSDLLISLLRVLHSPFDQGMGFEEEELVFEDQVSDFSFREMEYEKEKLHFLIHEEFRERRENRNSLYTGNQKTVNSVMKIATALLGKKGLQDLRVELDKREYEGR